VSAGRGAREAGRPAASASPFRQPKGVWAMAFACVVSFMGMSIGQIIGFRAGSGLD
jgi:hypothetical protein